MLNVPAQNLRPEQALLQRIEREQARRHLIPYSVYMSPRWYKPVAHHIFVAKYLEQVMQYIATGGKEGIGRLMIFEPPRYGKSTQVSQLFPSFLLGNIPDARIILGSYGAELADEDSMAVRGYVQSKRFGALFGDKSTMELPVSVSEERSSRSNWRLSDPHRGGVKASGVGGGIVGFGAHLLNINDPFKGRKEAKSEAYRRDAMTWYRSEAYTRLEDGGAVIITHTRWDPEDMAGNLLMQMVSDDPDADQWTVVMLPEIALDESEYPTTEEQFRENLARGLFIPMHGDQLGRKPGEVLWPEKYPLEAVRRKHANVMDFEAVAQFQQLPRMSEGEFFDDKDFNIIEKAPEGLQWYRYVDLALGKSKTSDFNATLATAMTPAGRVVYRDMIKERNLEKFLEMVVSAMLSDEERHTVWGFEDVAFQLLVVKELLKDKRLAGVDFGPVKPNGDKVERARPLQRRAKQGLVDLVRGSWNLPFIRIASAFPDGKFDDDVDTASGGLQMVSDNATGNQKTASSEPVVVTADQLFEQGV
jgi:predicted phage terminase large subunit-like protein